MSAKRNSKINKLYPFFINIFYLISGCFFIILKSLLKVYKSLKYANRIFDKSIFAIQGYIILGIFCYGDFSGKKDDNKQLNKRKTTIKIK